MSDSDDDSAVWPGFPAALGDRGRCPGCLHRLTATTCTNCGLVLTDPRAGQLLTIGRSIVELESERQQLIEAIRLAHLPALAPARPAWWETDPASRVPATTMMELVTGAGVPADAATVAAPASTPAPEVVAPTAAAASIPPPVEITAATPPAPPVAAPPEVVAERARPPRRRLTVPVLLLIVGVTLVGVAALFFLVLAWNIADIGMRALIIGGITLATLVAASVLRRFALTATAEAIAVLGVILLGLDAWAVRANDLFGAGDMDPVVYAGVATLGVGVVCRVWSVISRLRGPDLAATLALPAGLGLLVAGILPVPMSAAVVAGLVGTAVGGLAYALPSPWSAARRRADSIPERTALAVIGVAALVGAAAGTLFLGLESMAAQLVAAGSVIVLAVGYALLLRPREHTEPLPASRGLGGTAAAVAATLAASLGWQMAFHDFRPVYLDLIAPVVAVAVAVALDRWMPRGGVSRPPRIAVAVVGIGSLLMLLGFAIPHAVFLISDLWTLWDTPVFAAPSGGNPEAAMFAAIASAIIAVLLFLAPTLGRPVLRDARPPAAALVVIAGASATGIPAIIVGASIALAAIALIALARGARPMGWGAAAGIAAATAFVGGLASPWLWLVGVGVAVAVAVISRIVARPTANALVVLAVAPIAVCAVAAMIAPSAISAVTDTTVDGRAAMVLVQWVALVSVVAAVVLRLDAGSRRAVAWASYILVVLSFLAFLAPVDGGSVSTSIGEPVLAIVRAGALLAVLTLIAGRRTRLGSLVSLPAAVLVAPVAACVGVAVVETVTGTDDVWAGLTALAIVVVVIWVGALVPARIYGARPTADAESEAGTASGTPAPQTAAELVGTGFPAFARRAADIGAFFTGIVAAAAVPEDERWALLVLVALGFGGASVTRGWAGVGADESTGVPRTRATGALLAQAPRRLFTWPAFAAATAALWVWLGTTGSYEIEAFVIPPAVGLVLFAAVLTWLRREAEATIAVILGVGLGLVVPGLSSAVGSPVRGIIVGAVAVLLALSLAWTPARRVRMPALAGATTALVALAAVSVIHADDSPAAPVWLLLLVGVAYATAYGFLQTTGHRAVAADTDARRMTAPDWFATIVPPAALALASLAAFPSLDEPIVAAVAFVIVGALHLAAAHVDRLPLGVATRWTALAGAVATAAGVWMLGDVGAIEVVSIPIALILLGGSVLAMWRRARTDVAWPGRERIVWLAGLAVAIAPSVIAESNDVRTWLVIVAALLAAIECVVVSIPDSIGLKSPSALLLTAGALAMGARVVLDPGVQSGEFAALTAGAGALVIAAMMLWQSEVESPAPHTTALAAAGAALAVFTVGVDADGGDLMRTTLTAVIGGVIGVGGAALLRWRRWAQIGAVLAVAGLLTALIAVGARFAVVVGDGADGIEADVWALCGVGIVVAIGVMALRSTASRTVALAVSVMFSSALTLFAFAELLLLGSTAPDQWRTALTMCGLTAVGVVAWIWRDRLGVPLAVTAAVLTAGFGILALTLFAVDPIELVTVPPAIGLIVLGGHALQRDASVRTWPALGPGLALLTIPSLVYDFTIPALVDEFAIPPVDYLSSTSLWRVVTLGVVAVAMVVAGAVWRLQAPLVIGSVVLIIHAVSQLWPWMAHTYEVPWWLWLGIGGAVLIFLAARYERRMRQLRAAFVAVASLR